MKRLVLSLISLSLASCASSQVLNPWDGLTTETEAAATPLDCGSFPLPTETIKDNNDNITHGVYDQPSMNDLNDYRKCSEANEGIATEHVLHIGQLKLARKGLTEAGRAQRNIADMREQMLKDERQHHFFQSIGLYAVIIGMGFAL